LIDQRPIVFENLINLSYFVQVNHLHFVLLSKLYEKTLGELNFRRGQNDVELGGNDFDWGETTLSWSEMTWGKTDLG